MISLIQILSITGCSIHFLESVRPPRVKTFGLSSETSQTLKLTMRLSRKCSHRSHTELPSDATLRPDRRVKRAVGKNQSEARVLLLSFFLKKAEGQNVGE